MTRAWIAGCALAACLAAVSVSPPAHAATATWWLACDRASISCSDRIGFTAAPGEGNVVTVDAEPRAVVIRDLAGIEAGIGCDQIDELAVRCPAEQPDLRLSARFELGDGNDFLDARRLPGGTRINGGDGNDRLFGPEAGRTTFANGLGNDRMVGGAGSDIFHAGSFKDGSDTMVGGAAPPLLTPPWYAVFGDQVRYTRRRAVRIDMTGRRDDGERGEHDAVVGMERVETGSGNDVIVGTAADESFFGGGGHDVLRGGGGADDLDPGDSTGTGSSRRRAGLDDVLDGGEGADLLDAGGGADRLVGGPGRDQLDGGTGRDRIRSEDGDRSSDWVLCGSGRDSLLANSADFVMPDCERPRGGRHRGASVLAAAFRREWPSDQLLVQVGCADDTDCDGPVRLEVDGREIASGRYIVLPHDSAEVDLFVPTAANSDPMDRANATITVAGRSVPLALLPNYRITQTLIGIR